MFMSGWGFCGRMYGSSLHKWLEGGGRRGGNGWWLHERRRRSRRRKILPRGHCTRPKIHPLKKKSFLRTFWSNQILFQVIGNLCIKATGGSLLPKKHYHLEQAGNKHWVSVATRFQSCFLGLFYFFRLLLRTDNIATSGWWVAEEEAVSLLA